MLGRSTGDGGNRWARLDYLHINYSDKEEKPVVDVWSVCHVLPITRRGRYSR